LRPGGSVNLGRDVPVHLQLGDRPEKRDAREILHFEVRRAADVAANHCLAVTRLEILEVSLLAAEHAEAVPPAERQLHDGELARLGRDVAVDGGDSRISCWQWNGEVLEDDERDQQHGDGTENTERAEARRTLETCA
jgi:hypothetical protein